MAIEIEKKYRLTGDQYHKTLAVLNDLGADYGGEDFEENIIFRGGVLTEKRAVLRIRKIGDRAILTYKKRIQNDFGIKQQIEHETEVLNAGEIEKIIENLDFAPALIYEKRRKTFRLKKAEVVLDELPFGLFMEIEGSITTIAEVEMMIGAEDFETEHETYPNLTGKFGTKKGEVFEARFAK